MRKRYGWSIKLPIFPRPAHSPFSVLVPLLCIPLLHPPHVSSDSAAVAVHGPGSYHFLAQQSGTWGDATGEVTDFSLFCVMGISRPQRASLALVHTGATKEGRKYEVYSGGHLTVSKLLHK